MNMNNKMVSVGIAIVALVVLGIGAWWWGATRTATPGGGYATTTEGQGGITMPGSPEEQLGEDAQSIEVGDVDAGFGDIDADLNNL